jgi:hypothetical protein
LAAGESGRILRWLGRNLHHDDPKPGPGQAIHDSKYREDGRSRIIATGDH